MVATGNGAPLRADLLARAENAPLQKNHLAFIHLLTLILLALTRRRRVE